jgi:large subunit ribosomal protein L21
MYAIVEIAGQQFKVEEGRKIYVHRLDAESGKNLEFDRVLLIEDGDKIVVGEPTVKDFIVSGKVIEHVRGDKVIVFKKKKKKGYQVKNGHRQNFTQVEITGIGDRKILAKKVTETVAAKEPEPVVTAEIVEPVVEKPVAKKKSTARKQTIKEEVAEPEAVKKTPAVKKTTKKPAAKKSTKTKGVKNPDE